MPVAGYEYRVDGGAPVDVGNVLTYEVPSLTPATEYDFEVRAYDELGNRSAWSPVITVTTLARPDNAFALNGDAILFNGDFIVFNP